VGQAAGCIYFAGADAIWLPNMSWFWTGEIGVDPSGSGLVPRAESGLQARCKKKEQPGNPSGSGIEAPANRRECAMADDLKKSGPADRARVSLQGRA
jgi:hypothetical protein